MMLKIEELLCMSQVGLFNTISYLEGIDTVSEGNYLIWSKDDAPKPMLCVHLDTINTGTTDSVLYLDDLVQVEDTIYLSDTSKASCLGGDDRAGVWIVLKLIDWMNTNEVYPYNIGFFCDEEIGGLGSSQYDADDVYYNTTAFIGLDRRSPNGVQEVATYGMTNTSLLNLFEEAGYKEAVGSFTDASNLATSGISCINLSVGYNHEHTSRECLHLNCMYYTYTVLTSTIASGKTYPVNVAEDKYEYPYEYGGDDEYYTLIDRIETLEDTVNDLKGEVQELMYQLLQLKEEMLGL